MLITFKTLEQKTFKIEIEDCENVKCLKEKIAKERGEEQFPVAGQKLIYSGKILDDEKLVSECCIDPKNFVVVMVVKQKAKPADKPSETSTSQTAESTSSAAAREEQMSVDTPSTGSASEATSDSTSVEASSSDDACNPAVTQNTTETAESALLTGEALESSITELMSLGYSREQVMLALSRSYHNADRAAEYLLSGNIQGGLAGETEDAEPPAAADSNTSAQDISFLWHSPQFQRMRTEVHANPLALPTLLQGIGETNPELLALINQNQPQFISLLNRPDDNPPVPPQGGASGVSGGDDAAFQVQVTPSEKETIDRIVAMGFAEADVIQAFFACEKNEHNCINLLLND